MLGVITGFAIILAIIATGAVLARCGVIRSDKERLVLNRVAFYVASPALLFSSVARADASTLLSPVLTVVCLSTAAISLSYLVISRVFFRQDVATTTMGAASASYFNSVNIGLPVSVYVIGDPAYVVPVLVMQMVVFTPLVLAGLGSKSVSSALRSALLSPIVLGSVAGLIVALLGVAIPEPVMAPLEILGGASIPMILISFGASLRNTSPLASAPDRPGTLVASALKLIAMPLSAWGIGVGLELEPAQLYAAVILAALPTAQNVYNYAATYQRGMIIARDTVFITTFASLPIMLIIAWLFGY